MSWYNTQGPEPCCVLFSKVKYIRNTAKQNFCHLIDHKRASEIYSRLETILQKNGFRGEKLGAKTTHALLSLAEKQFIESDLVYSERGRAVYLNEPCNLTVALGGDNYITISSTVAGKAIGEAKNMASRAEELIDREIDLAYSESIGYLSPTVSECGSGLCLSASLYLPSLKLKDSYASLVCELNNRGMSMCPMFKDALGDIYILSYVPHYLASENDAAAFFSDTVTHITEGEKKCLTELFADSYETLLNRAHRDVGILLYSDILTESELLSYLSEIRLCHLLSDTEPPALPDVISLNYLCAEGLSSSVIASSKEICTSARDCDMARARLVSSYIKHKNEVEIIDVK